MMSTRLPPQQKKLSDLMSYWGAFLRDKSYIAATAGTFLLILGVFFPTLFLQLDSIKHGINVNLAFYTVGIFARRVLRMGANIPVDCNLEWLQRFWTSFANNYC